MPKIRQGKPSLPAQAPSGGPRARTHRLLIDTAMQLANAGRPLTVAEVAAAAAVSRATAYRYFPSRSQLVNAIVGESLGPVRSFQPAQASGRARIQELFAEMFPRFRDFEPQLRAAMQLALEHWALERAGELREEPFRRGHRAAILGRAAAPLRESLGQAGFDRLLKALSILFGIEPYIVLKDIWGSGNREVDEITRWMADALVDAALRDARRLDGSESADEPRRTSGPARAVPARANTARNG